MNRIQDQENKPDQDQAEDDSEDVQDLLLKKTPEKRLFVQKQIAFPDGNPVHKNGNQKGYRDQDDPSGTGSQRGALKQTKPCRTGFTQQKKEQEHPVRAHADKIKSQDAPY